MAYTGLNSFCLLKIACPLLYLNVLIKWVSGVQPSLYGRYLRAMNNNGFQEIALPEFDTDLSEMTVPGAGMSSTNTDKDS